MCGSMRRSRIIGLFLFCFVASASFGQTEKIKIGNCDFVITTKSVDNEFGTIDSLRELYKIENEEFLCQLKFYSYQDEGADCNNEYWCRESLEIMNDSLIINSHYYQAGSDPIPEWRKQIYRLDDTGGLSLVFDKYRFDWSSEWVDLY
jgi:hypothetical protein